MLVQSLSKTVSRYLTEILAQMHQEYNMPIATQFSREKTGNNPLKGERKKPKGSSMTCAGLGGAAVWTALPRHLLSPWVPQESICFFVLKCTQWLSAMAQKSLSLFVPQKHEEHFYCSSEFSVCLSKNQEMQEMQWR